MDLQITISLEYRRCTECGRVYYCESGAHTCPLCKRKYFMDIEDENTRLARSVTGLRAYIKKMKPKGKGLK